MTGGGGGARSGKRGGGGARSAWRPATTQEGLRARPPGGKGHHAASDVWRTAGGGAGR